MRWVTYSSGDGTGGERVGVVVGDLVHGLAPGPRLIDLLGDDGEALRAAGTAAVRHPHEVRPLDGVRLAPPVRPPTIRDFSVFEDHVRSGLEAIGQSLGDDWYEIPPFWFANVNAVVGPDAVVEVPANSERMDYELELAVVVGKAGRDLDPATAEDHIAGFCIMNDWSARDLQRRETACMPIGPSKGKDFATSLGPCLLTPDEVEDRRRDHSFDLGMRAWVNGRQYSAGNAADMYWGFGELLAYASRCADLLPGDVIAAGTCGTGCILEMSTLHGEAAYPWLEEGDEVELAIELIGRMRNRIVRGPPPRPLR